MKCNHCGFENVNNLETCERCGQKMYSAEPNQQVNPAQQGHPNQQVNPNQQVYPAQQVNPAQLGYPNQQVNPAQQGYPNQQMNPNQRQTIPVKKKGSGCLIFGIVGGVLAVLGIGFIVIVIIVVILIAIGNKQEDISSSTSSTYTQNTTEYSDDSEYTDDTYNEDAYVQDETESDETVSTTRVGNPTMGYIDIPSTYVTFEEEGGLGGLAGYYQYTCVDGYSIVTVQAYDDTTALDLANSVYDNFESDTYVDQDSLEGAEVTIAGYDAYQVYCYYPDDDVYVVSWCFETPDVDNYTHYLAIEFDYNNQDIFDASETFSMTD